MKPGSLWVAAALAVGAPLASAPTAQAQELKHLVKAVDEGVATLQYRIREDVDVCGNGIQIGNSRHYGQRSTGRDRNCVAGVGELRLRVQNGQIREVKLQPPETGRSSADFGLQSSEEVADLLLSLAETARGEVAEDAILPAVIAEGVTTWPRILAIARDRSRPEDVREQAVFWLGQEASKAATRGLGAMATDDTEEQEVREAAVFALSQRPAGESVPILMELAESADHSEVRRSALFWLAQAEDDRVLDFFERLLRGG